jgi:hypothetical protein
MEQKECRRCALYAADRKLCAISKVPREPEDSCSSFLSEPPRCQICGNHFLPPEFYIPEGQKFVVSCGECAHNLSKCQTCVSGTYCDFQQNPMPLPQLVQIIRREGNMVSSQPGPNPARVKETCMINCKCFNEETMTCMRNVWGTCGKYEIKNDKE